MCDHNLNLEKNFQSLQKSPDGFFQCMHSKEIPWSIQSICYPCLSYVIKQGYQYYYRDSDENEKTLILEIASVNLLTNKSIIERFLFKKWFNKLIKQCPIYEIACPLAGNAKVTTQQADSNSITN